MNLGSSTPAGILLIVNLVQSTYNLVWFVPMRLDKIKLSGFKSFVDPTTIPLPSNLIGVVGPNGCGKSNVIDAVRWVMGESSAKNLRGESMADVIFNGSNTRQPVGQASVELIFDNSDGTLGGQYAQYSEISVRRVVNRDGNSQYFQNGTRCRRRDITDIFLGTGLGPRGYSIIEQGMISRLIEAKPEELRVFLEEVAGISKYKERRRETETRIRHTRENMARLTDFREELGKQLDRLQRQSKTAEKYKILKDQERLLKAQLTALRWRGMDEQFSLKQQRIESKETEFQAIVAKQRSIEADIEKQREEHIGASEEFNEVQGQYYSVGSDIARIEQSIRHNKELRAQYEQDLKQAEESWYEAQAHIKTDTSRLEELGAALEAQQPALEQVRETEAESAAKLLAADASMNDWQTRWDDFTQHAAEPAQQAEVERTRLEHLERQVLELLKRRERLTEGSQGLTAESLNQAIVQGEQRQNELHAQCVELKQQFDETQKQITQGREENIGLGVQLDERRSEVQGLKGRHASLEALQQAALSAEQSTVTDWLEGNGYGDAKRLAEQLNVESGWELAVECVLGNHLEAVCINNMEPVAGMLSTLEHGSLTMLETQPRNDQAEPSPPDRLLAKVDAPWSVEALLRRVFCAENLEQALVLKTQLTSQQSVVTRDGIWLGNGWLRVTRDNDEKAGVLRREQEMKSLDGNISQLGSQIDVIETRLANSRQLTKDQEQRHDLLQVELQQANQAYAEIAANVKAKRSQYEETASRIDRIQQELAEIKTNIEQNEQETNSTRQRLGKAVSQMEELAGEREDLEGERAVVREALKHARETASQDREAAHAIALKIETMRTELSSTEKNRDRMKKQMSQLSNRKEELQRQIAESKAPLEAMKKELEQLLQKRVEVEAQLTEARRSVESLDHSMRALTGERHSVEQESETARATLDQMRMSQQEIKVRQQTLEESLQETGFELNRLTQEMPDNATEQEWQELVEKMARRIQRLGPINLAAIDEYKEQAERKEYLDAQHDDLTEALTTLENAMRKIDKETRAKFKETYEKVNEGFKSLFPRLFGGGHSYLELTGEDLLDTGVTVMARPPGKRNSSIHLLSGGEKALTAVALIFSIFQLNPAPFCMLDEVDAPLDDANVGRFCKLVMELSEKVQFIVITHNKITMEMVNQLNGVTMHEAGVSRIVAVDVAAAAEMASA